MEAASPQRRVVVVRCVMCVFICVRCVEIKATLGGCVVYGAQELQTPLNLGSRLVIPVLPATLLALRCGHSQIGSCKHCDST